MSRTAPTAGDFLLQFPEFRSLGAPAVDFQLSLSSRLLDMDAWDQFYSDGVSLDAAHNLAIVVQESSGSSGAFQAAAGSLSSTSAAGMSASFNQVQLNSKSLREQWYGKTSYGQRLLRLWGAVISPVDLAW